MLAYDDHDADLRHGPAAADPVVLVHGLAASRAIWRSVVPALRASGRRVVAVDVPGFGGSAPAGRGFALEPVARATWDGLPEDLGPVTLVGHSMGGAIAMTMAALEPQRVARLVLCAPAGLWRPVHVPVPAAAMGPVGLAWGATVAVRRRAEALARFPAGRRVLLGLSTAAGNLLDEDDVRMVVRAGAQARRTAEALHTVATTDLREVLGELPMPVGFLWGADDLVVPRRALVAGRAVLPDAPAEIVAGAGHLPMLERPDAFSGQFVRLLEQLGEVGRPAASASA